MRGRAYFKSFWRGYNFCQKIGDLMGDVVHVSMQVLDNGYKVRWYPKD